jgi:hypothetical protein
VLLVALVVSSMFENLLAFRDSDMWHVWDLAVLLELLNEVVVS